MTMDCIVVKHIIGTLTARSTICNFPILRCCWPSSPFSLLSIVMVNIAWERDEVAFILVDPTAPNSWIRNIGVSWPNCTWKQPHQANAARRKPEIKQIDHFKVFHQFWSRLPQGHSPIFKVGGFPRFLKDIPKCLCVCVCWCIWSATTNQQKTILRCCLTYLADWFQGKKPALSYFYCKLPIISVLKYREAF